MEGSSYMVKPATGDDKRNSEAAGTRSAPHKPAGGDRSGDAGKRFS